MLDAGATAPDFTLPNQDGEDVTLTDLRGKRVVLYFYPKADTPGRNRSSSGGFGAGAERAWSRRVEARRALMRQRSDRRDANRESCSAVPRRKR